MHHRHLHLACNVLQIPEGMSYEFLLSSRLSWWWLAAGACALAGEVYLLRCMTCVRNATVYVCMANTQLNRSQPNKTIFPWVFSFFSYPYVLCEHDRYKYIACSPPPKWKAAAMKAIPPPCRPICNNLIFSLLDPFRFMSPLISHAKFFVLFIYYLAWSQPMAMAV